ncbi:hypothetical protein ACHQM5_010757 [Ranunculus cassubicifolius]
MSTSWRKLKLEYIENRSARRSTFKRRMNGLNESLHKFLTLCDVPVCAVVISPDEDLPLVWPSAPEAELILTRFKNLPSAQQNYRKVTQEDMLRERIAKGKEQLKKLCEVNLHVELMGLMNEMRKGNVGIWNGASVEDAQVLVWLMERKIREVQDRIEALRA